MECCDSLDCERTALCYEPETAFKISQQTPPDVIVKTLTTLSMNREFARLTITPKGGLFKLFQCFDPEAQCSFSVPALSVHTTKDLLFIKSSNPQDLPTGFNVNFLSNIYHCLPHTQFTEPACLAIPFNRAPAQATGGSVKVLYNSAAWDEAPQWRDLSASRQPDDPVCCFEGNMCFVWLKHFCSFVVVVDQNGQSKEFMPLVTYVSAQYNARDRLLQLDAGVAKPGELVSEGVRGEDTRSIGVGTCKSCAVHREKEM